MEAHRYRLHVNPVQIKLHVSRTSSDAGKGLLALETFLQETHMNVDHVVIYRFPPKERERREGYSSKGALRCHIKRLHFTTGAAKKSRQQASYFLMSH